MAPSFGDILRKYRENSKDVNSSKRLSQERLGELLGEELGIYGGYSGPSVSYWENGKTQIHASERGTLLGLLHVLYKYGGVTSIQEANILLEAGNYKSLSPDEKQQIFPKDLIDNDKSDNSSFSDKYPNWILFLSKSIFFENQDLADKLAQAEEGPPPSWPRKLVVLVNSGMSGWTINQTLHLFLWFLVWLLGYWLLTPSLSLPFADETQALSAIFMYIAGSIAIPALAGLLTTTRSNPFWKELQQINTQKLRLYTHQGAFIGFHNGYFINFSLSLVLYYFGVQPALWQQMIGILLILVNAYLGARLIPYNLWRAYQRLSLADGAIFFIFFLFGPAWGYFFYTQYLTFLDLFLGPLAILLGCALLIFGMAWQNRKTGSTIIPAHWWVFLGGIPAVLYEITVAKSIISVTALAGMIITFGTLLAFRRIQATLRGLLGFLVVAYLLQLVLFFNIWVGRAVTGIVLFVWWRWGKQYLSFPLAFWGIIATLTACLWAWQQKWLPDVWLSIIFGVVTILLLWWDYRANFLLQQPD